VPHPLVGGYGSGARFPRLPLSAGRGLRGRGAAVGRGNRRTRESRESHG
jgi:hypothetical protein